jgi:hypothetical protein
MSIAIIRRRDTCALKNAKVWRGLDTQQKVGAHSLIHFEQRLFRDLGPTLKGRFIEKKRIKLYKMQ